MHMLFLFFLVKLYFRIFTYVEKVGNLLKEDIRYKWKIINNLCVCVSESLINSEAKAEKGKVEMGKTGEMQKSVLLNKPNWSSGSLYWGPQSFFS